MFYRKRRILAAHPWVHPVKGCQGEGMIIKWETIGPQRAMSFPFLIRHLPHGKQDLGTNIPNFLVGNITSKVNREYIKVISPSVHGALRLWVPVPCRGQLDPALAYHELSHVTSHEKTPFKGWVQGTWVACVRKQIALLLAFGLDEVTGIPHFSKVHFTPPLFSCYLFPEEDFFLLQKKIKRENSSVCLNKWAL